MLITVTCQTKDRLMHRTSEDKSNKIFGKRCIFAEKLI